MLSILWLGLHVHIFSLSKNKWNLIIDSKWAVHIHPKHSVETLHLRYILFLNCRCMWCAGFSVNVSMKLLNRKWCHSQQKVLPNILSKENEVTYLIIQLLHSNPSIQHHSYILIFSHITRNNMHHGTCMRRLRPCVKIKAWLHDDNIKKQIYPRFLITEA